MTEGSYKKKFHLADYKSTLAPSVVHSLLVDKMTKCYTQSDYPVYEKTVSVFDEAKQFGTIAYEIDNQSLGPRPLVFVEVIKDEMGSIVKVYSKGDIFRPPGVYSHQIHKWVDGKKVDCHSHGKI
jgi:hypothetical protein